MKRKILAVSAVLASFMGAPVAAAPVQWTIGAGGNGHFYEFVQAPLTFAAARAAALAMFNLGESGYLATVTSAAEQAFLDIVTPPNIVAWLGGSDEATEGVWEWVDGPEAGQAFTYTNWNANEPNNLGNEDYLVGWWNVNRWNDLPSSSTAFYVVEYNAPASVAAVPVPAALPLLAAALGGLALAKRRRKSS